MANTNHAPYLIQISHDTVKARLQSHPGPTALGMASVLTGVSATSPDRALVNAVTLRARRELDLMVEMRLARVEKSTRGKRYFWITDAERARKDSHESKRAEAEATIKRLDAIFPDAKIGEDFSTIRTYDPGDDQDTTVEIVFDHSDLRRLLDLAEKGLQAEGFRSEVLAGPPAEFSIGGDGEYRYPEDRR